MWSLNTIDKSEPMLSSGNKFEDGQTDGERDRECDYYRGYAGDVTSSRSLEVQPFWT